MWEGFKLKKLMKSNHIVQKVNPSSIYEAFQTKNEQFFLIHRSNQEFTSYNPTSSLTFAVLHHSMSG